MWQHNVGLWKKISMGIFLSWGQMAQRLLVSTCRQTPQGKTETQPYLRAPKSISPLRNSIKALLPMPQNWDHFNLASFSPSELDMGQHFAVGNELEKNILAMFFRIWKSRIAWHTLTLGNKTKTTTVAASLSQSQQKKWLHFGTCHSCDRITSACWYPDELSFR